VRTLERTCPVILLDCGTALTHPVTSAILKSVDAVTVVTTPSDDAVAACFSTLGWLERNGYERLAKDAAVAITDVRKSRFDRQAHSHVRRELSERVRTVLEFGYDAGLVRGGVIELDRLSVATREAALESAAWVVSGHAR
jgi:MinD-like ATPase involved in chromosome partitioning or flagellar assembly